MLPDDGDGEPLKSRTTRYYSIEYYQKSVQVCTGSCSMDFEGLEWDEGNVRIVDYHKNIIFWYYSSFNTIDWLVDCDNDDSASKADNSMTNKNEQCI